MKKKLRSYLYLGIYFFCAVTTNHGYAQTSLDTRGGVDPGGSIIPGYDSRTCDGTIEGAIRYNSATNAVEFCDSNAWAAPGGCTAPASCPNVGDVCSDGSLFAGFVVYNNSSCEPLYVTDNNQSTSSQWKNATGTDDITNPDDHVDGQYNRDNRGSGTFPAFGLCEFTYHDKSDWYLPARAELNLLWLNRAAIDANAAGSFITGFYWSSTEDGTNNAWYQTFGYGNGYGIQDDNTKTFGLAVRCVRRD